MCDAIKCSSSTWQRCVCASDAALLLTGGCHAVSITGASSQCAPSHRILLNAAAQASPEVRPLDVYAGVASTALLGITQGAVAAALQLPPTELVLSEVALLQNGDRTLRGNRSLLHWDWSFSLCAAGQSLPRELAGHDFEFHFSQEVQRFVAFRAATVRILEIVPLLPEDPPLATQEEEPEPTLLTVPEPAALSPIEKSEDEVRSLFAEAWWLPWSFTGAMLLVIFMVWLVFLRRRRRRQNKDEEWSTEGGVSGVVPGGHSCGEEIAHSGPLVRIVQAFSLDELSEGKRSSCDDLLTIECDEIVEVLAVADGWICGRVVGEPARMGYFPEDRSVWIASDAVTPPVPGNESLDVNATVSCQEIAINVKS